MKKLIKRIFSNSYDLNFDGARNVSTLRLSIIDKAKYSYMSNYRIEEIEDAFMSALLYVIERCKRDEAYAKKVSVSSVTFKMREIAKRAKMKEHGYTTRGTIPKGGMSLHIGNYYNEDGDNQIERMAIDPETGDVIMGS